MIHRRFVLAAMVAAILATPASTQAATGLMAPRTSTVQSQIRTSPLAQHCADADFGWTDLDPNGPRILQWAHLESRLDGFWVKSVSYTFTATREDGDKKTFRGTTPGDPDDGDWQKSVNARVDWGHIRLTYELPTIKLTDGHTVKKCSQSKVTVRLDR